MCVIPTVAQVLYFNARQFLEKSTPLIHCAQYICCRPNAVTVGVEFRATSVDLSLDPGDAAAITASGQLHLRLSKESHQKLGLLGSKSNTDPGVVQPLPRSL
jgi:hypothetical protein